MDRLKPCPFCGSKDIKLCGNHRDSFWFRCNKCASIDSYDTERQAVRAWNKRVAIPSAYKGMTNGEVVKAVFNKKMIDGRYLWESLKVLICGEDDSWWNSPYEPQKSEV